MALTPLQDFNILVVDADIQLGGVLKNMLGTMGFSNISFTPSGQEAMEILKTKPFDFIISEWNIKGIDGPELLNRIRRDRESPQQTMPVVMLSGRVEQTDVIAARDYGINEYVLKPFNAKTIFSRLERLIEKPRNFVISSYYVGPDRRASNGFMPKDVPVDRRKSALKPQPKPASTKTEAPTAQPILWAPDLSLKQKLGANTSLSSVVTPFMIERAQTVIASAADESARWLQENLKQLQFFQRKMLDNDLYTLLPIDMSETALTLSSRSGTFGNSPASQVAYLLYLFCRNHLRAEIPTHQMVAEKHIDALRITLNSAKSRDSEKQGAEIVNELRKLTEKYAA